MPAQSVVIVDFASDARAVPCGRSLAAVVPDGPDITIVRGTTGRDWADEAAARGAHVMLSGCDIAVPREEDWFAPACDQVRRVIDAGVPVLGVCFGHQIIVQALGDWDMVRRTATPEYGIVRMRSTPQAAGDPVLGALGAEDFALYNLHMDEVAPGRAVEALGLVVLAESERCAIHAFPLPGRPVWGVQAHPEITPGAMIEALARHPGAAEAAGVARDIGAHPSCQRPALFDAFLRGPAAGAAARDQGEPPASSATAAR